MSTYDHKIDEKHILGRTVKVKDDFLGKVIGFEFNDYGEMFLIIEKLNGGKIIEGHFEDCAFFTEANSIPVFHSEIIEALKVADEHRGSIVKNISYARQISGEDDKQYREALVKADDVCNKLLSQLEKYKIVS